MLQLTPIIMAVAYGLIMYHFSAWRTRQTLSQQSQDLQDTGLMNALAPLASALDVDRIRVKVYQIDAVNGLATPDGNIFITEGFLAKYRSGDVTAAELASVVAHELGHVALGHTRRRMIDFSGQNAVRTALALVLSRFLPGIGAIIANGAASLLAARMSRKDEFEADAYATALMVKAGLGAAPQKSLFRKLNMLTAQRNATPAWFLSHPKTEDRIAAIEANEAKWGV